MEEEKQHRIYRKIEPDKKYRVWKSTKDDRNYYKIQVTQKNYDNSVDKFYEEVRFKKGVEIPNQTDIIIKTAYENCRKNPADIYNPIFYLLIVDFEQIESQEQITKNALDEFNEFMDDVEITDEDLPF